MSRPDRDIEALLDHLEGDGFFVDSVNQKPTVGNHQWHVQLRHKSKHGDNAFSYFPGEGPSFWAALHQAAGNGGAISGRKDEKIEPRKPRAAADLLG